MLLKCIIAFIIVVVLNIGDYLFYKELLGIWTNIILFIGLVVTFSSKGDGIDLDIDFNDWLLD